MNQRNTGVRCILAVTLLGYTLTAAAGLFGNSCGKMDDWMEVIEEWIPNKDLNNIYVDEVREYLKPAFHDDVMARIWGSPYAEMSDRKRASIQKTIIKCSKEPWANVLLPVPFSNPPDRIKQAPHSDYGRWQTAIAEVNSMTYAELKDAREARDAAEERAVQQRKHAIAAAQARREQQQKLKEQRRQQALRDQQQAQVAAEERRALVDQYARKGPFRGVGAAYLNALYLNDTDILTTFDKMYAAPFAEMVKLHKGSGMEALAQLSMGQAGAEKFEQLMRSGLSNVSMVTSVAGIYVLYYEHAYPECMDRNPLVYKRTRKYEKVTTDYMGSVLSRSPAWTETDTFRINHRFKYVWDHMGNIEQGNVAIFDLLVGQSGNIRLFDAMNGMVASMHGYTCDSAEMRQLETNMLAYFNTAIDRMDKALRQ